MWSGFFGWGWNMSFSHQLSALLHNRAIGKNALTQMRLSDIPMAPIAQEEQGFFIEYPDETTGKMVRRAVALDDAWVDENGDIRLSVRCTLKGEAASTATTHARTHITALAYIAAIDAPISEAEHAAIWTHTRHIGAAETARAVRFSVERAAHDDAAFNAAMARLARAPEDELLGFLRAAAEVIHADGEITCAERALTGRINALLASTGHMAHLDLGESNCAETAA